MTNRQTCRLNTPEWQEYAKYRVFREAWLADNELIAVYNLALTGRQ